MMNGFEEALTSGVEGGTIILFPALGELIGERAGIVNLGTEGCMLSGALAAYAVGATTGSAWLGVIAGFFAGSVVGFAHGWLVDPRLEALAPFWVAALGLGFLALPRGHELDDFDEPMA